MCIRLVNYWDKLTEEVVLQDGQVTHILSQSHRIWLVVHDNASGSCKKTYFHVISTGPSVSTVTELGCAICVDNYDGFERISLLTEYKPRTQELASYITRILTGRRKHYYQVLEDFSIFMQCLLVEIFYKTKQIFGC